MESGSISSPDSSSSSSGYSSSYQSPSSWPTSTPSSAKRRAGRKKFRETRHPVYHGVRERNGGKWVCEVREPNKKTRIWLGTYPMPEMAARAHDVAVLALRGKSALLNFPDSKWAMPAAASTRPEDIRRAAAKAAEMHRPRSRDSAEMVSGAGLGVGEATLSSTGMEDVVMTKPSPVVFFDEEAVFNMPALLSDMAAGLLITPPAVRGGFEWDAAEVDTNLWAYEL